MEKEKKAREDEERRRLAEEQERKRLKNKLKIFTVVCIIYILWLTDELNLKLVG